MRVGNKKAVHIQMIKTCLAAALLFVVAGSIVVTETTESTEPDSPRVVSIGTMSEERASHQATLLKTGRVLISGGCAGRGCDRIHASVELYDPDTQSFQSIAPMATPRASHAAAALPDGRVLVSGGWTGRGMTATAEIFDPAKRQWTPVGNMTEARMSHLAVSLPDGRVLLMGGGTVEVFDPATTSFTAVGRTRTNHYLATTTADGRVLMTGGQDAEGEVSRSATLFDPATDEFQQTGDMAIPRVKHAAALLADGRVLVVGGSDEQGYSGRYAGTEIYDPRTGEFLPGPDMHAGRHKIRDAVAALPSGAVLVAGGAVRPELFDPQDQVFVPATGQLSGPQMFATATVLPASGDVLVLGGYDERTRPSASAWLVETGR